MTEDLIAMARESGAAFDPTFESASRNPMWLFSPMDLARFAALIEARAVARTREECAKVCDQAAQEYNRMAKGGDNSGASDHMEIAAENLAEDIRARGEES